MGVFLLLKKYVSMSDGFCFTLWQFLGLFANGTRLLKQRRNHLNQHWYCIHSYAQNDNFKDKCLVKMQYDATAMKENEMFSVDDC